MQGYGPQARARRRGAGRAHATLSDANNYATLMYRQTTLREPGARSHAQIGNLLIIYARRLINI